MRNLLLMVEPTWRRWRHVQTKNQIPCYIFKSSHDRLKITITPYSFTLPSLTYLILFGLQKIMNNSYVKGIRKRSFYTLMICGMKSQGLEEAYILSNLRFSMWGSSLSVIRSAALFSGAQARITASPILLYTYTYNNRYFYLIRV
jgi:hypothetical protein